MASNWAGVSQGDFPGEPERNRWQGRTEFGVLQARGVERRWHWLQLRETECGVTCRLCKRRKAQKMSWICKRPSGSRALSPALWSPSRKNMLAPELPRILINAMGGGGWGGQQRKGANLWGSFSFFNEQFYNSCTRSALILKFPPLLWLGNEVSFFFF